MNRQHEEWLAIGIHQIVADAHHNAAHMALAQELKRLYAAAGEPASIFLANLPGLPEAEPPAVRVELAANIDWYATLVNGAVITRYLTGEADDVPGA